MKIEIEIEIKVKIKIDKYKDTTVLFCVRCKSDAHLVPPPVICGERVVDYA